MGRPISNLKWMYASNENWLMLYKGECDSVALEKEREREKREWETERV
jgi:hypothetical protein